MGEPRAPQPEAGGAVAAGADAAFLGIMERAGRYNAWLAGRALPHLGRRVLDAGAGTGVFTEALAGRAERVVAVETDAALVPELRARLAGRANVEVVHGDALDPGLGDDFDSVVCFNVLEHVEDDVAALSTLARRLVPGGRLLLLVPAHPFLYGPMDETVGHHRRYRRRDVRERLRRAGYAVDEVRLVNPIGAVGWLVAGRVLRRRVIPGGPLGLYDRLVPLLRVLDAARLPLGLSVWAVAHRP